ncbi:unnamed protein product [Vitrella brassicaformis CCMP3155]|uniref:Uncharacterized protein n=1 Tax=Vitrella brassicaformis (strain CCMP3155) TaxID=1169540 RepID=A0A0G4EI00_VITBC|nr:unnamed protein product [Vitrella brassicaformis CCMP3155]|eukprot:CEL95867.1 unnamed protein product [Vitrella brassicaformis CCMP3155]
MQPTGAAPSSRPAGPALFQPADLFDLSLPISKMAAMAMATDYARRAALRSQLATRTRQQELLGHTAETVNSTLLNAVQQHIDKALSQRGLADVLAFDIGGDVEAGLKAVYVLERGSGEEWRAMGRFFWLAFIYRLTPLNATRPLRLSADALPASTAFHQLPLTMAIYKIIGHLLTYNTHSLALQPADNGAYRIGNVWTFRVVSLGELPGGHPYAEGYKRTDPVIRCGGNLFVSFSAFLIDSLLFWWSDEEGVDHRLVLEAHIGRDDPRYGRLLRTDNITEDQGIAVGYRYDRGSLNFADAGDCRRVIVSGWRFGETVATHLRVGNGYITVWTTEPSAADRTHPLSDRFPVSMPLWCAVLRRFDLESVVIDRGRVMGAG